MVRWTISSDERCELGRAALRCVLILLLALAPIGAAQAQLLNEQPMFGGLVKSPAMLQADEAMIAAAAKFGSRAQTSDRSVGLGWQYLGKRDMATAMKRFNQAWLLDPANGDAFHGFAVIVMDRDHDAAKADQLFQRGLAAPRQSPGIYLDYGRFLLKANRPADAIAPLRKAVSFDGMGADAQALLTMALYQSGDRAAACAERQNIREGG
jgi:Tfp pilus assembly protein PilF